MDDIDNSPVEEAVRMLEVAVKVEEFDKEEPNQPKSKLLLLFGLKYKCIITISTLLTISLTSCTYFLGKYLSDEEMRELLLTLTNHTKSCI
jgi:hypothetical protein